MKIITLLVLLSLAACGKEMVGGETENTPKNNFEVLWQDYDRWFSNFNPRNINWKAQYDIYRLMVNSSTSDEELWDIMTQMLNVLEDLHVSLEWKNQKYHFVTTKDHLHSNYLFSLFFVSNHLTDKDASDDNKYRYGKAAQGIGYIHINDFVNNDVSDFIDIIQNMGELDGLIIDARSNGGGNPEKAMEIASIFADKYQLVYSLKTRNGPGYEDFDRSTEKYIEPHPEFQFTKPVTLLTNRTSVSAADIFVMIMKELPNVVLVGENTAGSFSASLFRTLPNGWIIRIPHQRYFNAAGENLADIGVTPDIFIEPLTEDIINGRDRVLEAAITHIEETK